MKNLGIGEVARRSGIATSTIRYYERIGLLPPSKRVSGKRRYDENILQKIGVIRLAKQAGLTIEEIQTLLYEFPEGTPPSERWTVLATKKIAELDELVAQIQAMKAILEQTLACECPTLDDCGADEQVIRELR